MNERSIYFLDNDIPDLRRLWGEILGVNVVEISLSRANGGLDPAPENGVVVVHESTLPFRPNVVESLTQKYPGVVFLWISAAGVDRDAIGTCYPVRSPVLGKTDPGFSKRFRDFINDFEASESPDFSLLEINKGDRYALAILCEAYIGHVDGDNFGIDIECVDAEDWFQIFGLGDLGSVIASDDDGQQLIESFSLLMGEFKTEAKAIAKAVLTKNNDALEFACRNYINKVRSGRQRDIQ